MNMTIPKLVDRLRCFVVWFDASEAEILIDGKSIKSFDYELEPVLPPDGFDRRMERLNISTKRHVGETHRIVRVKMLAMPAEDDEFDNAAKEKEKAKWDSEKESRDEYDREMELWEKSKPTRDVISKGRKAVGGDDA